MSRFSKLCSFCGAKIPAELLLSPEERVAWEQAEAQSRRLLALKHDQPEALAAPTPLSADPLEKLPRPPFRPASSAPIYPRERVDAFLALLDYPVGHTRYARHVTARGLDDSDWETVLSAAPGYFHFDWRCALSDALAAVLSRLEAIGAPVGARCSDTGDTADLERNDRRAPAKYRPVDGDSYDAPTAALNTLLRGHSQLRADRHFEGSDSFGYLLLTEAQWRCVDAGFPEFAAHFRVP